MERRKVIWIRAAWSLGAVSLAVNVVLAVQLSKPSPTPEYTPRETLDVTAEAVCHLNQRRDHGPYTIVLRNGKGTPPPPPPAMGWAFHVHCANRSDALTASNGAPFPSRVSSP